MEENKDIKDIKYNYKKERKKKLQANNRANQRKEWRDFFAKNGRYFVAGVLLAALVIVVAFFMEPKAIETGKPISSEEDQNNVLKENAYPEINQLITSYYQAYANGDIDTLITLATPVSEREQGYISLFSQYVESYQNIICYTKRGLDDQSYLVNVYVEVKFAGVDTLAPGLDFFYVKTNEEGSFYIDNLYSQYNYRNMDHALDTEIDKLIHEYEQQEDVIALLKNAQMKFEEAIAADENLSNVLNVTIPEAISQWMAELVAQNTETLPEATETEATETEATETEEPTQPENPEPETPQFVGIPEGTVIVIQEPINIREGMSTETAKVGTAYKGDKVTVVMSYEEGWTKVTWNGKNGYIRTDLLQ